MTALLASLLVLGPATALAFEGTYELVPGWPAELSKIGPMNGTSGVDVDPVAGEVYMCQQRGSPRMSVWDEATGKLLRSWGDEQLDTPHGVRVKMPVGGGEPEIWVTDMGVGKPDTGNVVKAFTPSGKLLRILGEPGKPGQGLKPLQFGNVADLDWTADQSKLVIVDGDGGVNNRAVELDAKGQVVTSWGGLGTADGQFHISHGVAIDACNRVWIADRANNRTQIFTIEGKWIATWTCMNEPPYGVRMFGASEGEGAGVPAVGSVLVTGGGNGKGVGRPGFVNRLEVLSFKQDCANPTDLGKCAVAYSWEVDPDSTAHFSAISRASKSVYLCEVSANKFKKYEYRATATGNNATNTAAH